MKRLIFILIAILLLSGCTTSFETANVDMGKPSIQREKAVYIRDDIEKVIEEINALREKYKNKTLDIDDNFVYIDTYDDPNRKGVRELEFNNRFIVNDEYFWDLVDILDNSLAKGLNNYVEEIKIEKLDINQPVIEKIGRATVYVENRGEFEDNYISIMINLSDIENEHYRNIFNEISQEKYILNNVIIGEERDLVDFGNLNIFYDRHIPRMSKDLFVRYNIFFKDEKIEKVNILLSGNNEADLKEEDIDIFINLLNVLELSGDDKGILIKKYRDTLKAKDRDEKIALTDHNVLIKYSKGRLYGENDKKLVYFSIEKN